MLSLHSIYYDDLPDRAWTKPLSPTEYDILMLITQGEVTYELNNHKLVLKKGDIVYIPAGVMRTAYPREGCSHQKYSAHFTPTELGLTHFRPLNQVSIAQTRQFEYVKQRFQLLAQQWMGKLPYYLPMCYSMLQELLAGACREFDEFKYPYKKLALVTTIRQYIMDHYTEQIRIEELASLVDRTPNYVISTFREIMGTPPIDYLHQIRISAAREMLLHSHKSISQIAEDLGYCDQSYFNRMYRKFVGSPPSAILKERKSTPL
ncbi:AraC family transcriptional regulator [Paenibacillus roseipurpureus]|uniref:AraC family transcriptional regulator n=1 Tax=Paenibacillus roseopurpureus TaxID=2918901 RepID=A0AA96RJQ5_9BACL|nr:AraC family transcriptional regulator [Paenibacillus sp. MBLB1832]WNR44045.1 AraC family transcriptional regulator [Paenibacillus sp. MBLB1832]